MSLPMTLVDLQGHLNYCKLFYMHKVSYITQYFMLTLCYYVSVGYMFISYATTVGE